ncbi:hypothetical protein ACM64Y_11060 [Novispirillum sp. DQ9]|uniref:hypothetical protein n=1 Tax=Novispirillum sp. DQ9 TaxID=3398612 RepID=UPI003C7A88F6
MARDRFTHRPLGAADPTPFASAEEAWMWFWQCQIARDDGARFTANAGDRVRPCEPDDIYRAAARLHRGRRLAVAHLEVLGRFGRALTPPDGRLPGQDAAAALWREALDRLEEPLRAKGIVS